MPSRVRRQSELRNDVFHCTRAARSQAVLQCLRDVVCFGFAAVGQTRDRPRNADAARDPTRREGHVPRRTRKDGFGGSGKPRCCSEPAAPPRGRHASAHRCTRFLVARAAHLGDVDARHIHVEIDSIEQRAADSRAISCDVAVAAAAIPEAGAPIAARTPLRCPFAI